MVGKRFRALARVSALVAALAALAAAPAIADGLGSAGLTLNPSAAVAAAGSNHVVSATLVDPATGQALNGVGVRFIVQPAGSAFPCGANAFACADTLLAGTCTTNVHGRCSAQYRGPALPRQDLIAAFGDLDGDGVYDAGEPLATADKQWVGYATTGGKATGGGKASAKLVSFAFNARGLPRLKGTCNVRDAASEIRVRCLDVEAYVQTGRQATFVGRATIDGDPTTYRIDVTDNGEPGRGRDVFLLQTGSGFSVGGVVTQGNVQVR